MPCDRYAVLRFIVALFFLCAFAIAGLSMNIRDQRRGAHIERPSVAPVTFVLRWS